jgi:two-component system chemotaxis response regulator CheB
MHGAPASEAFAGLVDKVKAASRAKVRASREPVVAKAHSGNFSPNGKVIALGASTGGVEALLAVVSCFPANCPPTVITQHMPANFTASFAERLNRSSAATVSEAKDGAPLIPGHVYLAPGGGQHLEIAGHGQMRCRLRDADLVNGHRPSVDVLFQSVAQLAKGRAVGVILTGMGRDGASGLLAMRQAGADTVGQDEASCIVYGMPKAAFEIGGVERQLPLEKIGPAILNLCSIENRVRA